MRAIAERLLLREAAPTELWILHCASDIAFGIDKVHRSGDANGSALGIYKDFNVVRHD